MSGGDPVPTATVPCAWAPPGDALYRAYHDTEWGVPEHDGRALWEKLQLDGLQAGLAWITILRKRDALRDEFEGFDPQRLAAWTDSRMARALENPGIIRSPRKVAAIVGNARAYLRMEEAGEPFADFLWAFVDGRPQVNAVTDFRKAPAETATSRALAKALKARGFSFCGPVITYAFMQAVGMVNDHEVHCPRHQDVQRLAFPPRSG